MPAKGYGKIRTRASPVQSLWPCVSSQTALVKLCALGGQKGRSFLAPGIRPMCSRGVIAPNSASTEGKR